MPLISGKKAKTKAGFSENVRREMNSGKSQKQSVAIAYSKAGENKMKDKSMHHKKAQHHMEKAAQHHEKAKHHMEKMKNEKMEKKENKRK